MKPRYQELKELIVGRISSGELRPGDRVPSEHELVDTMAVSRMTANRALRELNDEGYVERIAGRGSFVADYRSRSHVLEVQNIADEIVARGHTHACEVLRHSLQHAHGEIAKALHVAPGSEVFHVLLVHYEQGMPIQVEDRHIVASFAPDCLEQDFERVTPSAYLSAIAPLTEAEQIVRAQKANQATRARLRMDDDEPCLVVLRRTWADGRPATFARLQHPGSRYELAGHYTPPGTAKSAPAGVVQLEEIKT